MVFANDPAQAAAVAAVSSHLLRHHMWTASAHICIRCFGNVKHGRPQGCWVPPSSCTDHRNVGRRRLVQHLAGRLAKTRWAADLLEWDTRTYGTFARSVTHIECRPCGEGLTVALRCGQSL